MPRIQDKYISPFTDFGFKKLFGTEPNKDLLIDFLNELLKKDEGKIIDLTFLPNEQLGRAEDDRRAIFDLYCENQNHEKFIVELQKAKQNFFKDRSIYYSTFPIQNQAKKGKWNFQLKSVYTIGILDFVFDEDKDNPDVYHHEVQLFDKKTEKVFYDKLTYVYLEMPKFNKTEAQLDNHFEKWLYVLKNLEDLTKRPVKLQERVFKKLFTQAEIANYSDIEYAEYEESLKYYRDLKNCIDTSFDDGRVEGKIEGIAEGEIKGMVKGEIKGKYENQRETVLSLHKLGIDIEIISQGTSLSMEEVKAIINNSEQK